MLSSHSVVSSSRTVRPCSPWGGSRIGHWRTTSSTVCSSAPHSQAAEEAIPHLYKQEVIHWWSAHCAARMLLLPDKLMRCCAAGTNACLDLRRRAFALDGQVSTEWSKCPGTMAQCARNSVAPLRRSSAGWMRARMGRLSAGVGRRHPVTIRKASLMAGSMRRVWGLWHQAGEQYSAVECTRARVPIRRVVTAAPQPEPVSRLRSATRGVSFLRSDSRCRRYVRDLSNVSPRNLGSEQKGRVSLFLTFSSRLASCCWDGRLDTVFVVLSFTFQICRYSSTVAMFLVSIPSTACQTPSGCKIPRSAAYAYFLETVFGRSEIKMLKRRGARTDPCGTPFFLWFTRMDRRCQWSRWEYHC